MSADDAAIEPAGPRFRRALGATFGVHVALGVGAYALGARWVGALAGATAPHPHGAEALSQIAPESFADLARSALAPLTFLTFASVLLQALVGVLLQLVWLGAMRRDAAGWRAQLRRALTQLPRALALGALFVLALVVGLALLGALPMLWHVALADSPDARLHDLGMLAACLPAVAFAFRWRAAHDLGCAAISLDASLREALRASWRTPGTLPYVGFWALSLTLLALGLGAAWTLGAMAALFVAQLAAFGRTLVRARWLATAQHRAARESHSRHGLEIWPSDQ
ncbi:MAG: hypothetical protein KF901_24600 [Myxococcales bacterium]|nr:hypothetical protein [Myxococcales bacterium]